MADAGFGAPPHHPRTIAELLPAAAARYGDRVAVIDAASSHAVTFAELNRHAARFAARLAALGLAPGEVVTLFAPNGWRWIAAYHGILQSGGVVHPVNALSTATEVAYMARDANARMLIATGATASRLLGEPLTPAFQAVIDLDDDPGMDAPAGAAARPAATDRSTICYTSGTTGHPKGAVHSQAGVLLNAALTAQMHARSADDVIVSALPLPHVYGNVVMNAALLQGSRLVLHERFDVDAVHDSMTRHGATMLDGVPTMYAYLCERAGTLPRLRCCTVGGQQMAAAQMAAVERLFGCPLLELWGMTELAGLGTTFAFHGPRLHGSAGTALPYVRLRIVDADDAGARDVSPGAPGELLVRGPTTMLAYHANQAATDAVFADGWLRTGDIARLDEDGLLYILDRRNDLIVTAGYNVYPAELERVLGEHPSVALVAVGALPDQAKGEIAKAYVVRRAGHDVGETELLDFCRSRLAAYKLPRRLQFVDDLPRTSTGKVLRRALAARFEG